MNNRIADMFIRVVEPSIVERIDVPSRPERRAPLPPAFDNVATRRWLGNMLGSSQTIWSHQAAALEHIAAGANVVVSTGTGSGKSLVFQLPVIQDMIETDATCLILYPQKSLSSDQLARWRDALVAADLDPGLVGEINGDVPMVERNAILERCRIVLMTADVVHCWMMRQLAAPAVTKFLRQLKRIIVDETHVLEGVFGTNCVYFFRRLRSAAATAKTAAGLPTGLQFIAASATIAHPEEHLGKLTGLDFEVVAEDQNGAPFHGLTLLHIEGPDHGAPAEKMLADITTKVASEIAPFSAIVFADTRQGVERVSRAIERDDVLPYRSGYEARDRRMIEEALRSNTLRAVVSTSALELGIDIPSFRIGINLGVPQTAKSFRQRAGRIGRTAPGVFVVVAPSVAFVQLGSSFREFYEGPVEPSNLYLDNRFIQFGQARCLMHEINASGHDAQLPVNVEWPDGFAEIFAVARPGATRPRDLDAVALLGSDNPHFAYPLRRIGEVTYALRLARGDTQKIGEIDHEKSMREAYPGATYIHMRKPYRVSEWRTRSYEHLILLEPVGNAAPTQPIARTQVSISLERDALIDGRLLRGSQGCLAEISLGVCESVEGYCIGSTRTMYRDASQTNPRMSRKQREFSTTGVCLRIDAPWFKGSADHQVAARQAVAHALTTMLARERSISPSDIRSAHAGIAILSAAGATRIDDAVAIFDTVHGGLRLTSPLFDDLISYLERLALGAELAGSEALLSSRLVERLLEWRSSLVNDDQPPPTSGIAAGDELIVYAPRSEVAVRVKGTLLHRTLLEPQLLSMGDDDKLMYRYEPQPGVSGWVAHEQIEAIGNDYRRMLWNPWSNELREIEA